MSGATSNGKPAITVLGAGRWGITLAHVAARNGCDVTLWARDGRRASNLQRRRSLKKLLPELEKIDDKVTATGDAAVACVHDTLILACGVADVPDVIEKVGPHLGGQHQIVHAIRGLDSATFAFPSQTVRKETCVRQVGAFLGPVVVEELLAGRLNSAVVASRFPNARKTIQAAFASPALRVYSSDDLIGVEVAAAGAAVGAIAIGFCLQLNLGPATLATFVTRGTAELARVVTAAGGKSDSAFGLAGLGDLLVRRESHSREVEAGKLLAQGKSKAEIETALGHLDAIDAATTFAALAQRRGIEAHLTSAVAAMLAGTVGPAEAIRGLMTLEQMAE